MDAFRKLKVLSVEQALSLPYLTYRLALEGMEVLKLENPPEGDPNRSAGPQVMEEEKMNAYFLPSNCGKRAVTLNLSKPEGRRILWDLIKEWKVDIFTCNQLPNKYKELGIDYETLRSFGRISFGLASQGMGLIFQKPMIYHPIEGRDPRSDWERKDSFICGVSLADISGSENGYGQVMKALYKREATGEGSRIDISLFSATLTYQIINITLNKSFGTPIYRTGNNQRFFAPASVYRTSDGFIYVGVGSDSQFRIFSQISGFESLQQPEFKTIRLRVENMVKLDQEINRITSKMTSQQVIELFRPYKIPIAR
jgi:crotonobetainyl-CoA:carnitine CoA-transferase CaiB-like acyl-CoA transferase